MSRATAACASAVLALTTATPASAQTIWTPIDHQPSVRVEALHPHLKLSQGAEVSAFSGALFVTGDFPVTQHLTLAVELPFARSSVSSAGESVLNNAIGNMYVGLQLGTAAASRGIVGELGMRLPLIGDDDFEASAVGGLTDLDRQEAFSNGVTTLYAAGGVYARGAQTTGRLRIGLSKQFLSKYAGENETFLDYGALGSVDADRVRLGAALTGRHLLTEAGSFSDRSFHHAAVSASILFEQFRPGLFVRVPIDKDVRELVSSTIGVTLEFTFR